MDHWERSDAALVRDARLGDMDAFAAIVDRYGPVMRRYARFLLANDDDAADATQDALVSAWQGIGSFRGDSALRTWLFTLVSRRSADIQRKRRPVPIEDEQLALRMESAPDLALGAVLDTELVTALRAALQELPWFQRTCWLLREVEGLSYDEIARTLGIATPRVRGYLHRGRAALAERMEAWR